MLDNISVAVLVLSAQLLALVPLFIYRKKPRAPRVRNVTVIQVPLRIRDELYTFLDVLQDAIPRVYEDIKAASTLFSSEMSKRKLLKTLSTFSVKVYEPDDLIRVPALPSGIDYLRENDPRRIAVLVESTPWSWAGRGRHTIHVLALRDRVPRKAILHALVEHTWPCMLEGHHNLFSDPGFARLREKLAGAIDVITELRSDVSGANARCSSCDEHIGP